MEIDNVTSNRQYKTTSIIELSKLAAAPTIRKFALIIIGYASMLLVVWYGSHQTSVIPAMLLFAASFLFMSWLQHAIMEELHDGVHYRLSAQRKWNELLSCFYSGMIGVSMHQFRHRHLLHHRYFGSPADPDFPQYAERPSGPKGWATYILTNFTGYGALSGLLSRREGISTSTEQHSLQHPAGTIFLHVTLSLIGVLVGVWWFHFVFWLLPLLTLTYGVSHVRTFLEHWTPERWIDPISGEERRGALFNFTGLLYPQLLGATFGYNKHGTHHAIPSIPNYNLEQAADLDYQNDAMPIHNTTYIARFRAVLDNSGHN